MDGTYSNQRWARMAFWLQYQDQESWNSLKISISKSRLLKLAKNIQNQYQNSWKNMKEFNINIKMFEMSAAESIINIRIFEMCKKFQNQIQFYWKGVRKFNIKIKILENSMTESTSKSRKKILKNCHNSISISRFSRTQPFKIKIQNQNQ